MADIATIVEIIYLHCGLILFLLFIYLIIYFFFFFFGGGGWLWHPGRALHKQLTICVRLEDASLKDSQECHVLIPDYDATN